MDAANRWETEAIRESRDRRKGRPAVSQDRTPPTHRGDWRTLREASDLTGIPIGTLRKWCRRATVESYLESDGELTLRMVEMGSVRARAETVGRAQSNMTPTAAAPVAGRQPPERGGTPESILVAEPATMIVPVDAWNKMLHQLGNLHEAGQQLAEARERAAKAETEARFLRERLAEMREAGAQAPPIATSPSGGGGGRAGDGSEIHGPATEAHSVAPAARAEAGGETVAFWRYMVRGWRGRRS